MGLTILIFLIDDTGLLYWLFLGMLVRNTFHVPGVGSQLLLNLGLIAGYAVAGFVKYGVARVVEDETSRFLFAPDQGTLMLRVAVLIVFAGCCFGVRLMIDRRRLKTASG
jgi:hypothetical protein